MTLLNLNYLVIGLTFKVGGGAMVRAFRCESEGRRRHSPDYNRAQQITTERSLKPHTFITSLFQGLPGGSDGKASVYNAGDLDSIPGSGRSSGEGNGNPLQYHCLENPMDRGAW